MARVRSAYTSLDRRIRASRKSPGSPYPQVEDPKNHPHSEHLRDITFGHPSALNVGTLSHG